ncbi:hypothetical protein EK21DRAFT_83473 [Setomelanomma holmii]|uniref:CST complex subunit STN1 n=1 Tax=Setomelanomma holmii TaxID=210430 RepID=A0A9P4LTB7_9PLEO|nr:hypothetical protein EK21DRAFT_83473 [Setomelanomma holmii]
MSTHPPARLYRLYPAYCFHASPTYDTWVKVTAADVQSLRREPKFPEQRLYFHINYPIRYVRLVGVVVAIDDINLKYTVLTIDDGSGANIELKIVRIPPVEQNPVDTSSNTTIDNVNIISPFGIFEVVVDNHKLDIGTVVKVKGTISEFRGVKQLDLKRIWVVTSTNEEVQAWTETAAFKREVLSKPWHLSRTEGNRLKAKDKAQRKNAQDYQRRMAEYEAKKLEHERTRDKKLAEREKKLELKRRQEEREMNKGALI